MKSALKFTSFALVILGVLAIIGSLMPPVSVYGLIGGGLYLGQGILTLIYLSE